MIKRTLDLIIALSAAIIFAVPYIVIVAGIKLSSPGPVLYWSRRAGRLGQFFMMPKFRSMRIDTPEVATDKLGDASTYITPFGSFLRRTSLDELPQLWNILRGEMSVVGPRPIVEQEISRYGPAMEQVLSVRPGLTGLWQVSGRNNVSYQRRVLLDLTYVNRRSLGLDLRILWRTVSVVLFPANKVIK